MIEAICLSDRSATSVGRGWKLTWFKKLGELPLAGSMAQYRKALTAAAVLASGSLGGMIPYS